MDTFITLFFPIERRTSEAETRIEIAERLNAL